MRDQVKEKTIDDVVINLTDYNEMSIRLITYATVK